MQKTDIINPKITLKNITDCLFKLYALEYLVGDNFKDEEREAIYAEFNISEKTTEKDADLRRRLIGETKANTIMYVNQLPERRTRKVVLKCLFGSEEYFEQFRMEREVVDPEEGEVVYEYVIPPKLLRKWLADIVERTADPEVSTVAEKPFDYSTANIEYIDPKKEGAKLIKFQEERPKIVNEGGKIKLQYPFEEIIEEVYDPKAKKVLPDFLQPYKVAKEKKGKGKDKGKTVSKKKPKDTSKLKVLAKELGTHMLGDMIHDIVEDKLTKEGIWLD